MTNPPIDPVLPQLTAALVDASAAVLQAPPGAGKSTRVPLALLDAAWLGGQKILMLEPRRLAARAVAQRMAQTLGEKVGGTVGYRIRQETRTGPTTRIEVVTEGILTRMLQQDPALEGYGAILFDEFHERSLQADLGLALTLDVQQGLRDDLRLLVMSATLDGDAIAELLGGAPVITSEGRSFPVETRHLPKPGLREIVPAMAAVVRQAISETDGDILAFLPGEGEIRRLQTTLGDSLPGDIRITPLFGALPQAEQDQALAPPPEGMRKLVLATAIAETSLTINGITVVIDSGYARAPRFDPARGMSRLETLPVSRAAADQRRGRAGRTAPGICYRLWPEAAGGALAAFDAPEITQTDLAGLALELAAWGVGDVTSLTWPTQPPAPALARARKLLCDLEALDSQHQITAHGKRMNRLPMHPRLAHMVLCADAEGQGPLACDLAALLEERDILNFPLDAREADLRLRLDALRDGGRSPAPVRRSALHGARSAGKQARRLLKGEKLPADMDAVGRLLALAYPDRVAMRRTGAQPRFLMRGGGEGQLTPGDRLADEAFLVIAELGGRSSPPGIFQACPLAREDVEELFAAQITDIDRLGWDMRNKAVTARRERRLGELVLSSHPLKDVPADRIGEAMLDGIRQMSLDCLPWSKDAIALRQRLAFLHHWQKDWPGMSEEALLAGLEDWLLPYLQGISRPEQLKSLDLVAILKAGIDWEAQQALDRLAPTHTAVPSGNRHRIDYSVAEAPVLPVKLQEMFGATETPSICNGQVPLTLHLLSPAGRPLQVTRDLPHFWANSYAHVKAEMKGRYPKHPWPDDPMTAVATAKTKRHLQ